MRLIALSTATLMIAGALTVPGPSDGAGQADTGAGASPTPLQTAAPASSAPTTVSPTAPTDTFGSWFQVTDDDEGTRAGLWVGRLGGEAFHVVDEPIVDASGPVGGTVIAHRSLSDHQTFSLVDAADGSMIEVLRTTNGDAPILGPDGRTMYWVELTTDTHGDVRRMQLPDGEHERILHDVPIYRNMIHDSNEYRRILERVKGTRRRATPPDVDLRRMYDLDGQSAGAISSSLGK